MAHDMMHLALAVGAFYVAAAAFLCIAFADSGNAPSRDAD